MSLRVLGIETSCDETAAAVYDTDRGILTSFLFSQIEQQAVFGGVVPELASRMHLEKINGIVTHALEQANVSLDEIDVIAVTNKPGLAGSLLVGVCFAKAIAWAKNKKLVGVNHLKAHAYSTFLEYEVPFPHLCLTASGGHTSLYLMESFDHYKIIGQTRDDAAGEAFDKIAKLMKLSYPGGPIIEQLAKQAGFKDYFKYPRSMKGSLDFSFSGLKTAVMYDLVDKGWYDMQTKQFLKADDEELVAQVASSLLVCIKDVFLQKLTLALKEYPQVKAITFVGGVACNKYLKTSIKEFCQKQHIQFFSPSPNYCTDNAAMVAFIGALKAQKGEFSSLALDIL